nr:hypothetical protein B0A51_16844 [Rachicladosporium sp. CCFEE 5018]
MNFDTWDHDDGETLPDLLGAGSPRETTIQIILSLALGIGAFLAFCVLRPRWPSLYAARKKHKGESAALPELPNTLFGWILPLWRIGDQQVLASAGLDAYVFLAFFKMALKFLAITLFFSLVVIKPVHDAYEDEDDLNPGNGTRHNGTKHNNTKHSDFIDSPHSDMRTSVNLLNVRNGTVPFFPENLETDYLWMYVAFAYLFTAIAIYLVYSTTRRIIEIRQEYLGTQTTVTDRTIKLSGIPRDLQDEARLKELLESLDIGKVEAVTICRQWKELDDAMAERMNTLRRLEEAYTVHLGSKRVEADSATLPLHNPVPHVSTDSGEESTGAEERTGLMNGNGQPHVGPYSSTRPTTKVRSGWLGWHTTEVDAIDYYEEELKEADIKVKQLRQKTFAPTPVAFVTMDSVAAAQMSIQALLDPSPMQLIANPSPAPSDVVWPNTYLTRRSRMLRAWGVTGFIIILTVFWSLILVPIAGLLSVETIGKVFPQLAKILDEHPNIRSLVNTQIPTLIASLLGILVPYLYYWLSTYQGMMSQGDVELSAISKNWFFLFFNFFIIFTILGTASKFYQFFERFGDALRDFREVAYTLAVSLQRLLSFYVNFVILQGIGLFPLRLLEIGSVTLYPIYRLGCKTPRDYAELVQPPVFSYGFYLPTSLLVFTICMVYSVLHSSWQVLLAGLAYFAIGHFVYKYQLLYAMDHQQHSTGRGWGIICDRIFVSLIFFQLTTAGQLILKRAIPRSLLLVPLILITIWTALSFGNTYKPLLRFIALRSVKRAELLESYHDDDESSADDPIPASGTATPERNPWADGEAARITGGRDLAVGRAHISRDQSKYRFVNPSLVAPLDGVWIADKGAREAGGRQGGIGTGGEEEEEA